MHPDLLHASLVEVVRPNPSARANRARGLALIASAIILGFFVLRNAWDQGVPVVAANGGDTEEATEGEATEGDDGAANGENGEQGEGETPEVRPPSEVTVLVTNTTDVGGAAATYTQLLSDGAGYQTVEPTNADEQRDTTAVLFVEGFEREAAQLAEGLANPPPEVAPMPDPPPVDPAGAQLVVLLGLDLAQQVA